MSFRMTGHVSGLSDEDVAAIAAEAEAGYDLTGRVPEPNPHYRRLPAVPADLVDAIEERAKQDGQSPEAVIRQALSEYLRSA